MLYICHNFKRIPTLFTAYYYTSSVPCFFQHRDLDSLIEAREIHPKKRKKHGIIGRGERRLDKINRRRALREERRLYRAQKKFVDEAKIYAESGFLDQYNRDVPTSILTNQDFDFTMLPSWAKLNNARKKTAMRMHNYQTNNMQSDYEVDSNSESEEDSNSESEIDSNEGELNLDQDSNIVDSNREGTTDIYVGTQSDSISHTEVDSPPSQISPSSSTDSQSPQLQELFDDIYSHLDSRRVFLIDPYLTDSYSARKTEREMIFDETKRLVTAIGWKISHSEQVPLRRMHDKWFFGSGKTGDLARSVARVHEDSPVPLVVIINAQLTGGTLNRLGKRFGEDVTVLDRTGLILEIFKRRAKHRESKLLVEMATLKYERSKLVGSREGLDRQRGATRGLAGAGETKFETDRRAIDRRLDWVQNHLASIESRRSRQRVNRKKKYPVVALVGYTNVGKSALLNRLTGSSVLSQDMLFASLDTYTRPLQFPSGQIAILVDTVGFVSDLPQDLLPAFRATLEEVVHANLILHVRDAANPFHDWQARQVDELLGGLGIADDLPILDIYNKADALVSRRRAPRVILGNEQGDDDDDENDGLEGESAPRDGEEGELLELSSDSEDEDELDAGLPAFSTSQLAQELEAIKRQSRRDLDYDDDDVEDDTDLAEELALLQDAGSPAMTADPQMNLDPQLLRVSALTGLGCAELVTRIESAIQDDFLYRDVTLYISVHRPDLLSFCHRYGKVQHREFDHDQDCWKTRVLFLPGLLDKFHKIENSEEKNIKQSSILINT